MKISMIGLGIRAMGLEVWLGRSGCPAPFTAVLPAIAGARDPNQIQETAHAGDLTLSPRGHRGDRSHFEAAGEGVGLNRCPNAKAGRGMHLVPPGTAP
jgi:hypothetical protein